MKPLAAVLFSIVILWISGLAPRATATKVHTGTMSMTCKVEILDADRGQWYVDLVGDLTRPGSATPSSKGWPAQLSGWLIVGVVPMDSMLATGEVLRVHPEDWIKFGDVPMGGWDQIGGYCYGEWLLPGLPFHMRLYSSVFYPSPDSTLMLPEWRRVQNRNMHWGLQLPPWLKGKSVLVQAVVLDAGKYVTSDTWRIDL